MASPGDATAADVPGRFDVVINGKGYVFADTIEPSLPFRTHRAIYDITPTFVQRSNVSGNYGDDQQEFWLTTSQNDWSLGEGQKFLRVGDTTSARKYFRGTNVDVSVPGQVTLQRQMQTFNPGAAISACAGYGGFSTSANVIATNATNLYSINAAGGIAFTAHGLGAAPSPHGICTDGANMYLTTTTAGTVGVRRWDGTNYATFSPSAADSITFLNNTLFGLRLSGGNSDIVKWDSGGVLTSVFPWKTANGFARAFGKGGIWAFGKQLLVLLSSATASSELWTSDGTTASLAAVLPPNFYAYDVAVYLGIAYISGSFFRLSNGNTSQYIGRPAVFTYDGSTVTLVWEADSDLSTAVSDVTIANHPAVAAFDGGVVWNDDTRGQFLEHDLASGAIASVGTYTVTGDTPLTASCDMMFLHTRNTTTSWWFPDTTSYVTSGSIITSLCDFDSSLIKVFRGIRVEFTAATDGDGGSVDIAYQVGSVTGAWTTLQTGATSGTEYTLAGVTGHNIAVRVTINKGTSTAGPTLSRVYVRAAPQLQQFRSGLYIIDATGGPEAPRELRDGTYHPLTGYQQVQNLLAAATSTSPVSVTDRVNGTYTAIVDLSDPEGWDVYEVHPNVENPAQSGSFLVRLKMRQV